MSNSIPFQTRPLLRQSNGGHLLSSTNALASWTRGVHYACLTPLERTPEAHAFLTYVGRLFETYALELLVDAHRNQHDVQVIGEQPYDRGSSRTADIAVVDGVDLLIEIESRRFSKEALLSSDPQRVLDELETMVTRGGDEPAGRAGVVDPLYGRPGSGGRLHRARSPSGVHAGALEKRVAPQQRLRVLLLD